VIAPIALIVLQPDMGTALVFIPIFIIMTFIAGAQAKHLVFTTLTGFLMIVFGALPGMAKKAGVGASSLLGLLGDTDFFIYVILALIAVTGLSLLGYRTLKQRYFYWIFFVAAILLCSSLLSLPLRTRLQGYQIDRMLIFLNPQSDRQGAGWNILQSITAIGSGGFWGKGYLQGTQSHYRYLPQQSTDFIFSIIAEEWGFLGGIIIIGLFTLILLRGMSIIWSSKDMYAMLIGGGILAMLFFHILVNVGMAMGVMPVTGIPLPMLSYGGSSLWTAMIGIGILMNVSRRRLRY
jgi:rod shape determining protein RodA